MTTPWLSTDTPVLIRCIIEAVRQYIGVCEDPPGSNTGPLIDDWNKEAGVPPKSYWCATFVGSIWKSCGAEVPKGYASCDNWMSWAKANGSWSDKPTLASAAVYGVPGDAQHIGIVVRLTPAVLDVEGNTSLSGYDRNGWIVAMKPVDPEHNHRILGFIAPRDRGFGGALA